MPRNAVNAPSNLLQEGIILTVLADLFAILAIGTLYKGNPDAPWGHALIALADLLLLVGSWVAMACGLASIIMAFAAMRKLTQASSLSPHQSQTKHNVIASCYFLNIAAVGLVAVVAVLSITGTSLSR